MPLILIITHLVLAVLLFYIINWIGRHSYSIGYVEISLFIKNEDSPAVNFLIRVLSPIVYIIIVASMFYYIGGDRFVNNIYWVNIYYLIFRIAFGLSTGRLLLINWYKQVTYFVAITFLSIFVYEKIIKIKKNILPDFTTLSNELWIIIIVFIFQVFNNIQLPKEYSIKRKDAYIANRYYRLKKSYGGLITNIVKNEALEAVCYAILIYEMFNRPRFARAVERLWFKITNKPCTLGIMQVYSSKMISDRESVKLGCEKIYSAYLKFKTEYQESPNIYYREYYAYKEIISNYNGGDAYSIEVSNLTSAILNTFFANRVDVLVEIEPE